ncbi:unnamed protein product [Lactuca saligna]|uniref:Uncharacterized protein n=1 Tax=Lactuca saligna TaxID=75948 RepID=A0AA35Y498_LACSI|nr:unnamed protein product [Lactuca saligna]
MENIFPHDPVERRALSLHAASHVHSYAAPGPAEDLPATTTTVPAFDVAPIIAIEEPQAVPTALSFLIDAPTIPAHIVNSGSLQIEKENSNKQASVGFLGGFIRM